MSKSPSLQTLDPHDHVLAGEPFDATGTVVPTGSDADFLTEATEFRSFGHGTWLGAADSLVVAKHDDSSSLPASVFTGSADGVVTRFDAAVRTIEVPPDSGSTVQARPLVETCRSNKNGADYSLGTGTWGIGVGDIDDGIPGNEVVVCAYGRIALFHALNLRWLREVQPPYGSATGADAEWLYSQPRRVQIAELDGQPGAEIVFTTLHGHLVVLDKNLSVVAEHTEGGIADLLVGPSPALKIGGAAKLSRPIYGLSARGHLFSLEMEDTPTLTTEMGRLSALSPLQFGAQHDLEEVLWEDPMTGQETAAIAALFSSHPDMDGSVRIFDPEDLSVWAEFGDLAAPEVPIPPGADALPADAPIAKAIEGLEPSMAIARNAGGDQFFVVLDSDRIIVWDDSGGEAYWGLKDLRTFGPGSWGASVATGDLVVDPLFPGDEVVISTLAGRVLWFNLDELVTDPLDPEDVWLPSGVFGVDPATKGTASPEVYRDRATVSTAAAWGLTLHPGRGELHAVDQAGCWWRIDPLTGVPELLHQLESRHSFAAVPPVADIAVATNSSAEIVLSEGMPGAGVSFWELVDPQTFPFPQPAPPTPPLIAPSENYQELWTTPYFPDDDTREAWTVGFGGTPDLALRTGSLLDDFWLCPAAGDSWIDPGGGSSYAAWWAWGLPTSFGNLVQWVKYDATTATIQSIWNSTGPPQVGGAHPPLTSYNVDAFGRTLKTETNIPFQVFNMQSLRIGHVHKDKSTPQAVLASGGRVMLLDGDDGTILDQSEDYGFGGMALALHDLDKDGTAQSPDLEVVFAPCYMQTDFNSNHLRSRVFVLNHDGGGGSPRTSGFVRVTSAELGDVAALPTEFPGYGACGIAVDDLDGDGTDEIVVTTINGELTVFRYGMSALETVCHLKLEGALGMFNSIVTADLVPAGGDGKKEVYIAGTQGIRRFDLQ